MPTTVHIPRNFDSSAIHAFVRCIVSVAGHPTDVEIDFDFSRLRFIDGAGLTVFCNAIEWLKSRNVITRFFHHRANQNESLKYLDD
jgi:anti-anti-sigma regulatory factor